MHVKRLWAQFGFHFEDFFFYNGVVQHLPFMGILFKPCYAAQGSASSFD